ncbi:hypothetical protein C356_03102 [Cryptococcus neoformans c45]|nr:hypothetical protein C356_03102 [Cryptococcus neoformans var. grubii c45]
MSGGTESNDGARKDRDVEVYEDGTFVDHASTSMPNPPVSQTLINNRPSTVQRQISKEPLEDKDDSRCCPFPQDMTQEGMTVNPRKNYGMRNPV